MTTVLNQTQSTNTKPAATIQAKAGSSKKDNVEKLNLVTVNVVEKNDSGIMMLPISQLCHSSLNVRKNKASVEDDKSLYESILAYGVIQNLVALPLNDENKYPVIGGGRRLTQLNKLVKKGKLSGSGCVPVKLLTEEDAASEISLSENFIRANMHPVDEFKAFAEMVNSGASCAEVSKRFGVTEKFVQQRMKLSLVAPCVLKAYQKGDITLDFVMVFTIADVKQQKNVWEQVKDGRFHNVNQIRNMLKKEAMESSHYLVEFVGREAYEQAGGVVTGDLFSESVYFDDGELINTLAMAKLDIEADKLKKQGWMWVTVLLSRTYDETSGYTEIVSNKGQYKKAEKSLAGCVVALARDGSIHTFKGLVAKSERKLLKQLQTADAPMELISGDNVTQGEGDGYSNALNGDLKAHRLVIAKHALMTTPELAIDALHYSLCLSAFGGSRYIAKPINVSFNDTYLEPKTGEFTENKALTLIEQHKAGFDLAWIDQEGDKARFEVFCKLDESEKQKQIAYASAMMLESSLLNDRPHECVENLMDTLAIDFPSYWRPTAPSFLKRISIPQLMSIAQPVMSEQWVIQAKNLKKKDLVEQIDGYINGDDPLLNEQQKMHFSSWMPEGFVTLK